jgi:hypothetical protein
MSQGHGEAIAVLAVLRHQVLQHPYDRNGYAVVTSARVEALDSLLAEEGPDILSDASGAQFGCHPASHDRIIEDGEEAMVRRKKKVGPALLGLRRHVSSSVLE